eukprot:gnl/TRDRNA2_/TRDRNA2_176553_c0_seq3.p1 gnl/TRDRNA2_/TRDRNA2_176553_c0~~gnl/TRDRNA2_/TRDRNA2_176553_c0_seq3.p1  ORF type:complete len:319 (-),score=35.81 gnl/TRDRNA2_/TRDRNA2_176553_c0_seq3:15-947(-)
MAAVALSSYTEEVPAQRSTRPASKPALEDSRYKKTKFCMFYLQGACKYTGDTCAFAHNYEEMHEARRDRTVTSTRKKDVGEIGTPTNSSEDGTGGSGSGSKSSESPMVAPGYPQMATGTPPTTRARATSSGSSGGSSGMAVQTRPTRRGSEQSRRGITDRDDGLEKAVLRELQGRNQEAMKRAGGSPQSSGPDGSGSTSPPEQTPSECVSSSGSDRSGAHRTASSRASTEATTGSRKKEVNELAMKVCGLEAAVKELQDARNKPAYLPVPAIRAPPGLWLGPEEYASSRMQSSSKSSSRTPGHFSLYSTG